MMAASKGYQEMVISLVDRGADIDLVDGEGRDAIAIAKRSGHDSVIKYLQAHIYTVQPLKKVT